MASKTTDDVVLGNEYEHEPGPMSARRSTFSVSMVWLGFPMIITGAMTGSIMVAGSGVPPGVDDEHAVGGAQVRAEAAGFQAGEQEVARAALHSHPALRRVRPPAPTPVARTRTNAS